MSLTTKMGLISCFVKISVIILSITAPLSAHTLPTESISPRAVTSEDQSGLTYHFEFQNEQGKPLSKEEAAGIKVLHSSQNHHANNSAGTSHLHKRRGGDQPIDETFCDDPDDQYVQSVCLLTNKDWQLDCHRGMQPGPFGLYVKNGACLDHQICIQGDGKGYISYAHCVSHDSFVELALSRTSGDNHKFHHTVSEQLPAGSVITLQAYDRKTSANIGIAHLEMSAQSCVSAIGNIPQCATKQSKGCDYCMKDVLTLEKAGTNRITYLARFGRTAINLYLHIMPAKP